jgi:hypothetical protein
MLINHLNDDRKSRHTCDNVRTVIRTLFRQAIRDEYITANPATLIQMPQADPRPPRAVPNVEKVQQCWIHSKNLTRPSLVRLGDRLSNRRGPGTEMGSHQLRRQTCMVYHGQLRRGRAMDQRSWYIKNQGEAERAAADVASTLVDG